MTLTLQESHLRMFQMRQSCMIRGEMTMMILHLLRILHLLLFLHRLFVIISHLGSHPLTGQQALHALHAHHLLHQLRVVPPYTSMLMVRVVSGHILRLHGDTSLRIQRVSRAPSTTRTSSVRTAFLSDSELPLHPLLQRQSPPNATTRLSAIVPHQTLSLMHQLILSLHTFLH